MLVAQPERECVSQPTHHRDGVDYRIHDHRREFHDYDDHNRDDEH
jgi:hypothetical protein